jgi:hypothetical protein
MLYEIEEEINMDSSLRNHLLFTESNFPFLCTQDLKNGRKYQQVEFSASHNKTS